MSERAGGDAASGPGDAPGDARGNATVSRASSGATQRRAPGDAPGDASARRVSELVLTRLAEPGEWARGLARDVRAGLTATPKRLPPKYFYDERGSRLFDRITELDEYYLTRAETEILERTSNELCAAVRPDELIELGSGYSRKTRLLLEAMREHGGSRYVAFDVSEDAIRTAALHLARDYEWLELEGVLGDFQRHLGALPARTPGRALFAFLGSTIGNLHPSERVPFLTQVRRCLRPGDRFLLGVDLVKDRATLEAAYDDALGVTAEFNKNVLAVLNRELEADFPLDAFAHRAFFDAENAWIEMRLVARRPVAARVGALELDVRFEAGEELHTEISCKFTRAAVASCFAAAGLVLERFETNRAGAAPAGAFALALARRA